MIDEGPVTMLEQVNNVLQWIDEYGADKVFLVWFFILYLGSRRKLDKLQDARLEDNKEALGALIESKFVMEELARSNEKLAQRFLDLEKEIHDQE